MGANGETHERLYDAAWAGDRRSDEDGSVGPIGNTVDTATATYTNTIGAAQLTGFWRDPGFDPSQKAFYYARVLEIPTPRWSTRDAVAAGMALPGDVPATIQERAWTSPIWYRPPSD